MNLENTGQKQPLVGEGEGEGEGCEGEGEGCEGECREGDGCEVCEKRSYRSSYQSPYPNKNIDHPISPPKFVLD